MNLITQFLRDFDNAVRQRGADYFRQGRVLIDSVSAARIMATVRGSSGYQVELEREGRKVYAACTCAYFEIELCKHIWAVIMAADLRHVWRDNVHQGGIEPLRRKVGDESHDYPDDDDLKHAAPIALPPPPRKQPRPRAANWRAQLAQLNSAAAAAISPEQGTWPSKRELLYVIDVDHTSQGDSLYLEVFFHDLRKDGTWSKPKLQFLRREALQRLPDRNDRRILASLVGATQIYTHSFGPGGYYDTASSLPLRYLLTTPQLEAILPGLCQTGRCRLRVSPEDGESQWLAVAWEEGEPWQLRLEVRQAQDRYEMSGALVRNGARMDLTEPLTLVEAGILFTRDRAARYEHHGAFNWIQLLREHSPLLIPAGQCDEFLAELLLQPALPPLELPPDLHYEESTPKPRPRLTVKPDKKGWRRDCLLGELSFEYDGVIVAHGERGRGFFQTGQRRLVLRDRAAEHTAVERLQQLGCRPAGETYGDPRHHFELKPSRLLDVVRELIAEAWQVEAEGKIYRPAGKFSMQVESGIDWFELHGAVEFGDSVAHLPELLAALRRGENLVKLGDGSFGLLPQEWLEQYAMLAELGTVHEDHLRFKRSQVGLLDALVSAQPQVNCDALFTQVRDELRRFAGIEAAEPPAGFVGELRPYQKEGLGWLGFLRQFGFGGCLADDMGLGKTVQVLAMLEARRELRMKRGQKTKPGSSGVGPSLVVVPKSLIFNWQQEAARFTPRLRLLDHTGHQRRKGNAHFADYDVILTTYGTLRNDAQDFTDMRFDYVILDEAQAIKNAQSESAKAARLLQCDHRLAMSGTPIENHLGELWSLFEFLNPGMLGAASVFKLSQSTAHNCDAATRRLFAQALRPFLLRRTKDQVVRDLPPKVEQTLYCELESKQRKLYDDLRDHYRVTLLGSIDKSGIGPAKIQILEALLRLRQAALHPGLLDKRRRGESSAKLDMLLPQLREVLDEGHKTLVFSQFTGMLAILRQHLDREHIVYEYLDGKTADRQACVERFQTDPDCKLFLISLKAGGVGLNLTAAQYVFLLDPWWNPAVEAQAIDRAHRIGQANRVFAYRLIARGTVEEKVLELQNTKRDLADAIVGADNALLRNLGREDLELLLS